jgi:thiamine-phosphate pyrophosphorylase
MVNKATDKNIWRLLDANVNRAREGLRIVEDTARFVLDHAAAARAFRGYRHDLDALVRMHYRQLLSARHVESDSGRKNPAKPYKNGVTDLLAANFKRCEEALRVIEEYGRILSPKAVAKAQGLRFEIYKWEKKMSGAGVRSDF